VGAYTSAISDREKQAKRDAHVHWLISHHPEIGLAPLGVIFPSTSPSGYTEAKRLWLEAVATRPSDASVLRNASVFLFLEDPEIAEDLARRGSALAPAPEWHETLALIYESRAETASPADRVSLAASIVEQHERALVFLDDEDRRYTHEIDLARWAIEAGDVVKARHHALRVLDRVDVLDAKRAHNHGPYWAHIVLGKVALIEDDPARASEHLVAAASPGVPFHGNVPVSRPDLSLAAAMASRGERDAVIRYVMALELLWPEQSKALRAKRAALERDEPADLEEIHRRERERRAEMQRIVRERHTEGAEPAG
jgi:hypothetical protein